MSSRFFISSMLVLGACMSTVTALPNVTQSFCAFGSDSLTVGGELKQQTNYTICMNRDTLQWTRGIPIAGTGIKSYEVFFGSNNTLYTLFMQTKDNAVINCTSSEGYPRGPTNMVMPFDFLAIDAGAKYNGTVTTDGEPTDDYLSVRPVKPPFPAENMHWYLSTQKTASGTVNLLRTDCLQTQNGMLSSGARNFGLDNAYTPNPSPSAFSIPPLGKVQCKPGKPRTALEESFGLFPSELREEPPSQPRKAGPTVPKIAIV